MNAYASTCERVETENSSIQHTQPAYLTLCDLIETVHEMAKDDELTAKIVAQMLNSGKVKLIGSFRGKRITFV